MRLILVVWSLVFSMSLFASVESEVDASRFEHKNGTLIDRFSGLQWQNNKDVKIIIKNWQGAIDYCAKLILDGKSDWRLPNKIELEYAYKIKNLLNYASHGYWSSSEYAGNNSRAWVGWTHYYISTYWIEKSYKYYVRCIRGKRYNILTLFKNNIKNTRDTIIQETTKLLYLETKKTNTVQAYSDFIKNCPNAPQVKEARQKILKILKDKYKLISNKNNIAGYEWFIRTYPNAPQVKDAIANIHKLAFNEAKDIDTISAYNTFIISYPMAKEVNQANKLAKELERYKYTDTLPEWVRGIMPDFLADILNSIFGIFSSDEKKSRALLIKAKQIERQGNEYYGDKQAGYIIVANRMYDLLQEEYNDTDATLRFLESEEFKDFMRTFKSAMRRINDRLDNIAHYSSEILEVSKEGFSQSHADSQMAAYHQEEKTKWDKYMHFRDKGYQ